MRRALPLVVVLCLLLPSCGRNVQVSGSESTVLAGYHNGTKAREAPMLAERVRLGELPPVEERLPDEPLVVTPVDQPGLYGGTWHQLHEEPTFAILKTIIWYAPLLRWNADSSGVGPGLAKSWDYSDGGRTLTVHLRKGLKWSDGHPYTSTDFAFWYELCTDGRLKLTPPGWCFVNGKPMTVEAPDPLTIVMRFAGPNYFCHLQLATGFWNSLEYNIPRHYMLQFHPDHNSRYKDFVVFERKNITHQNPDRPTMCGWRLKATEAAGSRVVFERNPYFCMVDALGRQLPYIDRVVSTLVTDQQVRVLRLLAGEADAMWRHLSITDLSLFLKGQKRGDYRIKMWQEGSGAISAVLINWDQPDPVLRRIFHDRRFRRALAYAVPRDKINQVIFHGMAVPQSSVISAQSWHFADEEGRALYERWCREFADFDLDKANALLDDMGLRRNARGVRMRPDDKPLTLVFLVASSAAGRIENDEALMITDEWRKLGIRVIITTPPGPEISNRISMGKYDVTMMGQSEMDLFTYPDWVFPANRLYWHPLTGRWYATGGKEGNPPVGPAKTLLDIYDRIKSEPDLRKSHKLVQEAVRVHIEEGPFSLGTVGQTPSPVLVKNRFKNVPENGVTGPWAVAQPASSYPEQFYIDEGGAR